ncbi:LysR family transcriptional regulator [Pseudomonas sp. RIT-PI-a]|uniref:LysR family transcriptional regulator n=1 Tax=Pseudomonas sp. RIT-PI-a TaxID=1681194 RepID=UPI000675CCAD|nr:LysR family transcriptional regulator [Pseudomonas sp. RIT-PI-a]KNC16613.1 LysR family transcriptional regulator [Pseudomonas sp. RIT-PI-a]
MDRIIAAKVFLEAVKRSSISGAAEHLGMSRAMASRYVGSIEEWAQARLLHRTTRKLSLTPAGELTLPICEELIRLSETVSAVGTASHCTPKGLVRVTASSIFAEHCLTDILMKFLQLNPLVSVDLQVVDRMTNLAQDGIDLAIRVTNDLDPTLIATRLGSVHSYICASPEYLGRCGTPDAIEDLTAHNCLTYAHFGRSEWKFKQATGTVLVPVTGSFTTNEAAIVVRAALSGTGIAMLPGFAVAQEIADGRLVRLFPDTELSPLGIHAVYLSRHRMPSALKALIAFLKTALNDEGLTPRERD